MNKYLQIALGIVLSYLSMVLLVFVGSGNIKVAFTAPLIAILFFGLMLSGISLFIDGVNKHE